MKRIESYSNIRALLDFPDEQSPSPHQILNQMLTDEQKLNLKLTNTRQAWNLVPATITTVKGQSEYPIASPLAGGNTSAGKVYFVVRATGKPDSPYLPIAFDDYSELDYGKMPDNPNDNLSAGEKVSFYRTGFNDPQLRAVIQPAPQGVLTYQISFYGGGFDKLYAAMNASGILAELTFYRDLQTAIALSPYAKWGNDVNFNTMRRKELRDGLMYQFSGIEKDVEEYIDQINSPVTGEMGYWNEA